MTTILPQPSLAQSHAKQLQLLEEMTFTLKSDCIYKDTPSIEGIANTNSFNCKSHL